MIHQGDALTILKTLDDRSDEAVRMTVTSGRKCYESSPRQGLAGSLQRMLLTSPHFRSSRVSALTWSVKDTKYSRTLYRLRLSKLPIDEIGYGLLPTLLATEGEKGGPNAHDHGYLKLSAVLARVLLPTPRVSDTEGGTIKNAQLVNGSWRRLNKDGVMHGIKTKDALGAIGLRLQPDFAEWMMGFPRGWTALSLPQQSTESTDSRASETRSSRRSQKK